MKKARIRRLPGLGLEPVMEYITTPMTETAQLPETGGAWESSRWRLRPREGVAFRGLCQGR